MVGQECFHGSMRRGGLASSAQGFDADQGRPISRVLGALCTIYHGTSVLSCRLGDPRQQKKIVIDRSERVVSGMWIPGERGAGVGGLGG